MTKEEIEIARTVFINSKLDPFIKGSAPLRPLVDAVDEFARSLVVQAYEDAAKAQCGWCACEDPVEQNVFAEPYKHLWVHLGYDYEVPCKVQTIRDLINSFSQETVEA